MEETNARMSTRELDARVRHRRSFQIHPRPCLLGHKLQYAERVRQWFDLLVDNRWSAVGSPWTSNGRMVGSMAISPNESMIYLVGAAADYSIRVWDLRTDQPVGDPLLHDDILTHVVMSPDGRYIIGAGLDVKIYV